LPRGGRRGACWLDSTRLHAFLATIVALLLLWQLAGGGQTGPLAAPARGRRFSRCVSDGQLAFHRPLPGLCSASALNGFAGWQTFALNALLMAGVGVARE
jgi:hypothetical protein